MDNNVATKSIVLKGLQGEDITLFITTLISQWHTEQIEAVYLKHMTYDMDKKEAKFAAGEDFANITFSRLNKMVEVLVKECHGLPGDFSVDLLKQTVSASEYKKLTDELEQIYSGGVLSEEKKSPLPDSSL